MSHYLRNILKKNVLLQMNPDKRELYTYVIQMEDELAETVSTPDDFIRLISSDQPHRKAARRFGMTLFELLQTMKDLERDIHQHTLEMEAAVRWIDYTEKMGREDGFRCFLVDIPSPRL
ncbi:hypothetical protein QRD89_02750 [Halobacillus sp. ACCC02827]|uniref:hypothetical protein n=1 Tax=Halobacillus sp. ACCC02827 TaxID=3052090 RepID=UPI0025709196|nr:hypothetical protein [Halobacillus sp. ACCC02827]WJE16290.1 hypothetical protein QRD89_02750 [Halobacillus sp. ACCC02827]